MFAFTKARAQGINLQFICKVIFEKPTLLPQLGEDTELTNELGGEPMHCTSLDEIPAVYHAAKSNEYYSEGIPNKKTFIHISGTIGDSPLKGQLYGQIDIRLDSLTALKEFLLQRGLAPKEFFAEVDGPEKLTGEALEDALARKETADYRRVNGYK